MANLRALPEQTIQRLRKTLWCLTGIELIFAIVVLGGAGTQAYKMTNDVNLQSIPGKLDYSIFIAVVTFILLPILLVLQYISPRWWRSFTHKFSFWPAVIGAALFSIFWIGASGSAFFTCSDMCGTFGPGWTAFIKYTSSLCCQCDTTTGVVLSETLQCAGGSGNYNVILGADDNVAAAWGITKAFSILNMLLFFASTAIWTIMLLQRPSSSHGQPLMVNHGAEAGQSYGYEVPSYSYGDQGYKGPQAPYAAPYGS